MYQYQELCIDLIQISSNYSDYSEFHFQVSKTLNEELVINVVVLGFQFGFWALLGNYVKIEIFSRRFQSFYFLKFHNLG